MVPHTSQKSTKPCHACSAHPPAFTNVLPLLNSAIVEYVLRLYSSRLLKRRLHNAMMTGEMKVFEWLRPHPSSGIHNWAFHLQPFG